MRLNNIGMANLIIVSAAMETRTGILMKPDL